MFILVSVSYPGALLAVLFLRGVGVVGHRKSDADSEKTAREDPEEQEPEPEAVRPTFYRALLST